MANQIINDILANVPNWRDAVTALIDFHVTRNECFSSGEIAKAIRECRPDLAFSVTNLGDHVRDLFYGGGMGQYLDGFGNTVYPAQIPRTTQGLGRTPPGQQVFVYGPDSVMASQHQFEVDIPYPPGRQPVIPTTYTHSQSLPAFQAPALPGPTQAAPTGLLRPAVKFTATVHTDRRLCVPRGALEAYIHATGQAMRGGEPVYVRFDGGKVIVTMHNDPTNPGVPYDISAARGRVLFPSNTGTPFIANTVYAVEVSAAGLVVDLANPVG